MENTSDSFMPRPLLFCLKSERSVCYSVPDNSNRIRGKSFSDIKQMHEDALEFVRYLKTKFS